MGVPQSICGTGQSAASLRSQDRDQSFLVSPCACGTGVFADITGEQLCTLRGEFLENLIKKLFCLHDLNGNGLLEEPELVWLNEKIAELHHGEQIDTNKVKVKYKGLFRSKLDPQGLAVPYEVFRAYTLSCLDAMDPYEQAQEMIVEQFIAEADMVRALFCLPPMFCTIDGLSSYEAECEVVVCPTNVANDIFSEKQSQRFDIPCLEQRQRSCDDADIDEGGHETPRIFLSRACKPSGAELWKRGAVAEKSPPRVPHGDWPFDTSPSRAW